MASFRKVLLAAAASVGAGCGGPSEHVSPVVVKELPTAVTAHVAAPKAATVEENLAALRSLQIVTVDDLVENVPREAFYCYGPCPGSEAQIAEARAKQPARLAKLVDIAEHATGHVEGNVADEATIQANLQALRALDIVSVGEFVKQEAVYTGHCYGVCPEDQAAADRVNAERAAKLAEIAAAAKDL